MKKVMLFAACLSLIIKKIFFNKKNVVINPNCKEAYRMNTDKENNMPDEYLTNYKTTTRWQTL
jgi:hypothetical protein